VIEQRRVCFAWRWCCARGYAVGTNMYVQYVQYVQCVQYVHLHIHTHAEVPTQNPTLAMEDWTHLWLWLWLSFWLRRFPFRLAVIDESDVQRTNLVRPLSPARPGHHRPSKVRHARHLTLRPLSFSLSTFLRLHILIPIQQILKLFYTS